MSINELRGQFPFSPQDVLNVISQLGALTTTGVNIISSTTPSLTIESRSATVIATLAFNSTAVNASGQYNNTGGYIRAQKSTLNRFALEMAGGQVETGASGGTIGSWFAIRTFQDDGTPIPPSNLTVWNFQRASTHLHAAVTFQIAASPTALNTITFTPADAPNMPVIMGGVNNNVPIRFSPSICIGVLDTFPCIYTGAGAPTIGGANSSLYFRTDGTVGARMYVKQATAGTNWLPVAGV